MRKYFIQQNRLTLSQKYMLYSTTVLCPHAHYIMQICESTASYMHIMPVHVLLIMEIKNYNIEPSNNDVMSYINEV